jgi:hypothetical protein
MIRSAEVGQVLVDGLLDEAILLARRSPVITLALLLAGLLPALEHVAHLANLGRRDAVESVR